MPSSPQADVYVLRPAIALTGRLMFTLIFILSGITHFTRLDEYVALMPAVIPFRAFWVMISALVELLGAALVASNRSPRLGAWLIVLFLVPVTITVHGTGMLSDPDQRMRAIQLSFFLKGITMAGAALLITQLGVRRAE
ncbi:MAG TPA: DoxX family membrane protein [Candidatus Dormibacteraeota bacterium]|nr:DoxX family membrane protein [Candidatus Dormibacteraeota bacterium]